jgi:16S rRNA (guanine527-N7)-methyltransferase
VHLLDVGTGAGFPGLVCKAARPGLALTLVEPRLKRVSFLRHIARALQLDDVSVLACRIEDEDLIPSTAFFTHITSRAVTDVGTFLGLVRRFAPSEPAIICMKGPKWQQELAAASDETQAGHLEIIKTVQLRLPFSGAERCLLVLKILAKSA